jgi:spore maturation protein CgeB
MKFVLFCHSLLSDWNHGNAHFLRGLVTELSARGHEVTSFERVDAWSPVSLAADHGGLPLSELREHYPLLDVTRYAAGELDLEAVTDGADVVIVHEWNEPELVEALGRLRSQGARFTLLFHDTHHRLVTSNERFVGNTLAGYDGVLAFGRALRDRYHALGWGSRAFTFHEAADTRVFRPLDEPQRGDLVWVGNYGDDERSAELDEFLFGPCRELGLTGTVYGVRYPEAGLAAVKRAGLAFGGYLPNFFVPRTFAAHRVTVHVPRRPYAQALPGIPTIRVFEALACGIPLVSAPWSDAEQLFQPDDFWLVQNGAGMRAALRALVAEPLLAAEYARRGRKTILARHTCAHRADELVTIVNRLRGDGTAPIRRTASTEVATPWA